MIMNIVFISLVLCRIHCFVHGYKHIAPKLNDLHSSRQEDKRYTGKNTFQRYSHLPHHSNHELEPLTINDSTAYHRFYLYHTYHIRSKYLHHIIWYTNQISTTLRISCTTTATYFIAYLFVIYIIIIRVPKLTTNTVINLRKKVIVILFIYLNIKVNSALNCTLGQVHACALSQSNKLKCWGSNEDGELGYGDIAFRGNANKTMGDQLSVVDLGTDFIPRHIAAGDYHTCALSTLSAVKCWGYNQVGQLGYGDNNDRGKSVHEMGFDLQEVELGAHFVPQQLTAGIGFTCALSQNNSVKCWGENRDGYLGYGDDNNRGDDDEEMGDQLSDIDLGADFSPIQITAGYAHVCALSATNTVKCWGQNDFGQLGLEDVVARGPNITEMGDQLPVIKLGSNFSTIQITAGLYHTCALSDSNRVKCWGQNDDLFGQLGYGDINNRGDNSGDMGDALLDVDLGATFTPIQISAGGSHTCAVSQDQQLKCWGQNDMGQLGFGDKIHRGNKTEDMGDSLPFSNLGQDFEVIQVVSSQKFTCAISQSHTMKCWGKNNRGQLGLEDTNSRNSVAEMGDALLSVDLGQEFIVTREPTVIPSSAPIKHPSQVPSQYPTALPSMDPSHFPAFEPTEIPSNNPTKDPSAQPSIAPTSNPSHIFNQGEVNEIFQSSISPTRQSLDDVKPYKSDAIFTIVLAVAGGLLFIIAICVVLYCFYGNVKKKEILQQTEYMEEPEVYETGSNKSQLYQIKKGDDNHVNPVIEREQHMDDNTAQKMGSNEPQTLQIEKKEACDEGIVVSQTKSAIHLDAMEKNMIVSDVIQNDFVVVGDDEIAEGNTSGNTQGN